MASGHKRHRLQFFNYADRPTLRIEVAEHTPEQKHYAYCASCGQNKEVGGPNGNIRKGHRTTYSCQLFPVPLCVELLKV